MEQRDIPRLGRPVSCVGFGGWQLGADWGDVSEATGIAAVGHFTATCAYAMLAPNWSKPHSVTFLLVRRGVRPHEWGQAPHVRGQAPVVR